MQVRPSPLVVIFAFAILIVPLTGLAVAKEAKPPTPEELTGVWIGFDRDELRFTRLELRQDSTGFLARVAPADTTLHDQGVQVYRVTRWKVDGWNIEISMSPLSNATKVGYIRGRVGLASLELVIGGPENRGWKEELILYPESRMAVSNQETKEEIQNAEKK